MMGKRSVTPTRINIRCHRATNPPGGVNPWASHHSPACLTTIPEMSLSSFGGKPLTERGQALSPTVT